MIPMFLEFPGYVFHMQEPNGIFNPKRKPKLKGYQKEANKKNKYKKFKR